MLNGPIADVLSNRNSVLSQNLSGAETDEDKVKTIYLSMLSRYPNDVEMDLLLREVQEHGDVAYRNIVWAVANSHNFRFIQ
jgi:hypothetical protein